METVERKERDDQSVSAGLRPKARTRPQAAGVYGFNIARGFHAPPPPEGAGHGILNQMGKPRKLHICVQR